jgi:hypothetical protein
MSLSQPRPAILAQYRASTAIAAKIVPDCSDRAKIADTI